MTDASDPDDRTDTDRLAGLAGLGVTRRDDDARERTAERIRRAGQSDRAPDDSTVAAATGGTAGGGDAPAVPLLDGGTLARAFAVPSTYKVKGELADQGGTGVFGHATAVAGSGRGVFGQADSVGPDTVGVEGLAAAASGETTGVHGETASTHFNAEGVRASALSGDATALVAKARGGGHGVEATTDGDQDYAVWARHTGAGGTANDHGVVGETYTNVDGVAGVKGIAQATSASGTYGVKGISDSAATASIHPAGVYGETTTTTGVPYGVYGTTAATSGYGVYSAGDSKTAGNHEVTGHVDAGDGYRGNVGASAYLGSGQTVAGDNSFDRVQHDSIVVDDRNEFNTTTHEFVCDFAGDYHVETAASFDFQFSEGTNVQFSIEVDGTSKAITTAHNPPNGGSSWINPAVSKTLKGLSAGDAIYVEIRQDSGTDNTLKDFGNSSYLTVTQVG